MSNHTCGVTVRWIGLQMNAIRMVWIISRHYNTDERMVPLMERIAAKIADKVEVEVNIRTILRRPPELAKRLIKEAQTVLESWLGNYMNVRAKIEESGTHTRWEFDRKRLFEQTSYMARVCADLHEVQLGRSRPPAAMGGGVAVFRRSCGGGAAFVRRVDRRVSYCFRGARRGACAGFEDRSSLSDNAITLSDTRPRRVCFVSSAGRDRARPVPQVPRPGAQGGDGRVGGH
jgi:hypothetical protein